MNAELPKLANNATIADSVPACIPPKGVCQFAVTMSNASLQPACTIGGVKFPRVILDCPGEIANKRFRPSYLLCPTARKFDGESLDLDRVEIGEDNNPVTLFVDRDKNKGDLFMGDIFVDRSKPFKPIPYNNVASLGTGIGDGITINCNQGCHKPTVPAAAKGVLQPFKPLNPFGDFKGTDLAKSVIFTDIADKKVYPGLENVPANTKKDFQNVCTAISNNKQKITQANTDPKVDLATVNVVDKLCTSLFSKVK